MRTTHHSEYLKLESVFIKPVQYAFISNSLLEKQWQELNYLAQPDMDKALEEYEAFENTLRDAQVEVHYFPQDDELSIDSIYCRDAAIATDFGMIICEMGKSGRRKEPSAQKQAFLELNIPILGEIRAPGTLEGGDVAWLDEKTLAVGHTYRTNTAGISQLKALLQPHGVEVLVAELPHYKGPSDVFHLMSILSPVASNLAVVYSPLMPITFRNQLLERGYQFVEVPEDEFESMGCNVLALSPKNCMMVAGNPKTQQALEAAGCKVIAYEGKHISVYGGGGPTCLTRPMLRSF
jgi:N-dimethylarginine dimethylaminohydrolase